MANTVAIILAAGQSKRMKSDLPKVLHQACGKAMIDHVLDAARGAGADRIVIVVGHKADVVKESLQHHPDVEFALQAEQLGTGHAVNCCRELVSSHHGPVLVLTGDTPLLRAESLGQLVDELHKNEAACVVGTAETENNHGLGRIVRDADGAFLRITEHKDCTEEELNITEINTGCFAYDCEALFAALSQVGSNNSQGEFYLTDCAEILRNQGKPVRALKCFSIEEAMGVNTQEQLAEVEKVMQSRKI